MVGDDRFYRSQLRGRLARDAGRWRVPDGGAPGDLRVEVCAMTAWLILPIAFAGELLAAVWVLWRYRR